MHFGEFRYGNAPFTTHPRKNDTLLIRIQRYSAKGHIRNHVRRNTVGGGEDVFLAAVRCTPTIIPLQSSTFEHPIGPILCIVITVILAVAVLLGISRERKRSDRRMRAEVDLVKNRIAALSGQPHVIFNSLTAIQELCADNPMKARDIIQDFSSYLRGNLYLFGKETIPFSTEMEFCKAYIALEQVGSPCKMDISWKTDRTDFSIAPTAMQTVLEYLLLYGRTTRQDLQLTISSTKRDHDWCVQVETNTPASCLRENPQAIVDLDNVRKRMRTLCDGDLTARKDTKTTVLLLTSAKTENDTAVL